ncbi:MAG: ATP-binding protein [Ilumatobacteraceae bacterium]
MTEPWAVLRREYAGDLKTLHAARRDAVEWFQAQAADEPTRDQAALIVSELCSNAIQNSPGLAYDLQIVRLDDDHAAISVRKQPAGTLPPPHEDWQPAGHLSLKEQSLRGRGLAIVDSLSEDVAVEHFDDTLVLTATVRINHQPT